MYYIGIDVHKKKCVTTIKGDAKKVLKRTSFDNDITGINGFTGMLRSDGYTCRPRPPANPPATTGSSCTTRWRPQASTPCWRTRTTSR